MEGDCGTGPAVWVSCRDPDDDVVLETALAGEAGYVVRRDEGVAHDLELMRHAAEQGVQLLTVNRFLSEMTQV